MVIGGYPLSDFISTEEKPRDEQTFKLNFELVLENKSKNPFAKVRAGEIKKLVDNSVQTSRNPQHMQERPKCVRLEKLIGGL